MVFVTCLNAIFWLPNTIYIVAGGLCLEGCKIFVLFFLLVIVILGAINWECVLLWVLFYGKNLAFVWTHASGSGKIKLLFKRQLPKKFVA